MRIAEAGVCVDEGCLEVVVRLLRELAGMANDRAQMRARAEVPRPEGLHRHAEAQGLPGDRHRRVADEAVVAQAVDVEHLVRRKDHVLIVVHADAVDQAAVLHLRLHPVRRDRPKLLDLAVAVPDDLRVSVSPGQDVRHQNLAADQRRHVRVGLVVHDLVHQAVVGQALPVSLALHQVQGQGRDRAADQVDRAPDRAVCQGR